MVIFCTMVLAKFSLPVQYLKKAALPKRRLRLLKYQRRFYNFKFTLSNYPAQDFKSLLHMFLLAHFVCQNCQLMLVRGSSRSIERRNSTDCQESNVAPDPVIKVGHFRVPFRLRFKASPSAKPFL